MAVLQNLKSDRSIPEGHSPMLSIVCRGTEMDPRISDGDVCYFDRGAAPKAGDDVVVTFRDGRSIIRRLISRKADCFRFGMFNPPREQIVPSKAVETVYRIIIRAEA